MLLFRQKAVILRCRWILTADCSGNDENSAGLSMIIPVKEREKMTKNLSLTLACFALLALLAAGCPEQRSNDGTTPKGNDEVIDEFGFGEEESLFSSDESIDNLNWGSLVDMVSSSNEKPVVESPAPVIEELATAIESLLPVVESPAPVIEELATAIEPLLPVVESPAPAIEGPVPVIEEPAPIIESPVTEGAQMSITKAEFGEMPEGGQKIDIYTLTNANGASMKVLSLGGIVYELNLPDKDGNFGNVSANVQTVEDYLTKSPGFGTLIGRFGNRIAAGKYAIDDVEINHAGHFDGKHLLHGGNNGFSKAVWDIEELKGDDFVGLTLKLTSDEAHQKFPGTVECVVTYKFNNKNEWEVDYTAVTDKATPINLTQHIYFNLSAFQNPTIRDEVMMLNADEYIPVDAKLIPTGDLESVEGTAMD